MTNQDLPALYHAANDASNKAQAELLRLHKTSSAVLIFAALMAMASTMSAALAFVSAVLFIGSLGLLIYMAHAKLDQRWYQTRALAESVKTATWRLTMGATPFDHADEEVNLASFRSLLSELLRQNAAVGKHLPGEWAEGEQITPVVVKLMRLAYPARKSLYLERRIDDQRAWYARRASYNQRASRTSFIWACIVVGAAIVMSLVRIAVPDLRYLPIETMAVVASSMSSWKQVRRYDELASAYALTAYELGIIRSRYDTVTDLAELQAFVSDAENAFSREHTQWAARRDN